MNTIALGLYSYPGSIEVSYENTAKSQITVTEAPVVAKEAQLADVLKAENNYRLYEFKNVTVNKNEEDKFQLVQDGVKVEISDITHQLSEEMMATVVSVTGYLRIVGEDPEFILLSYEATPAAPEIPVVDNIAALSKIEGGEMENPSVKLMLKNAKITYVQNTEGEVAPEYSVMYALLEDETGAVEISDLVAKAKLNNWFNGELKEGVALNGYVIVDYSSFFPRLIANDETAKSEITVTPTTIVPTEAKIADLQKDENHLRMFELKNVDLAVEDGAPVIKQDDASIMLSDMFSVLPEGMPETAKFESVTGVVFVDYGSYVFCPTSYKLATAAPIEVNSIAELNKLGEENEGATIKLKLTNAQITVADASMSSAIIEDETGAFNASYFFAEAMGMEMLTGDFKQGSVLNGYLYATYSYGSIEACELTANSAITTAEAPVVATEADFAEVLKAENNYRLYEFKGITVNKNELDHFQLVKGDAKAEIADRTHTLEESMMATVESVVGYFRVVGDDAEFTLISYKTAIPNGISALEVAAKNAAVYNLNGAKVRNIGESVKGLAKGVYVVGGKKIVVK